MILLLLLVCLRCFPQFVTLQGRQFKDENGNDFNPVICNYTAQLVNEPLLYDFKSTHLSPHLTEGEHSDQWECGCNPAFPCEDQIANDFIYLLSMGFNTVRVFGLEAFGLTKGEEEPWCNPNPKPICTDTGLYAYVQSCHLDDYSHFYFEPLLINNTYNKANIDTLFARILKLLTIASNTTYNGKSLKVMLITGGSIGTFNTKFPDYYKQYLDSLAHFISSQPMAIQQTLFAYDLFNEPFASIKYWPWALYPDKQEVCNYCNQWYYALKNGENEEYKHLVTLGGGFKADIFEFDPGILTLDFYSQHFYPDKKLFEYDNNTYLPMMINRMKGYYYWLQTNCPMPWTIGENAFTAPDINPTVVNFTDAFDGTWAQQIDYLNAAINGVWQCSGSGYSWYHYQGGDLGILKSKTAITIPPTVGQCNGDSPWPGCHGEAKPAHCEIENFTAPPLGSCNNNDIFYYDPYNHENLTGVDHIKGDSLSGTIEVDSQHPIKDAVINAMTYMGIDPRTGKGANDWYYTYSNAEGKFKLIPINYIFPYDSDFVKVDVLKISATGAGRLYRPDYYHPIINNDVYLLTRGSTVKFSDHLTNLTIPAGFNIYKAWNDLTVDGVTTFEPGSSCDFTARQFVDIFPSFDFNATAGCTVHIYNSQTFSDCGNFEGIQSENSQPSKSESPQTKSPEIEVSFLLPGDKFDFTIIPNPNYGIFSLEIEDQQNNGNEYSVTLQNLSGSTIRQMKSTMKNIELNFTDLAKGAYFVNIKTQRNSKTKTLILK
jgi:hypothetical protein